MVETLVRGRYSRWVAELINPLTTTDVADLSKEFCGLDGNTFSMALRDRRLFVYGLVKYTDVFGANGETEFRLV